MRPGSSPIMRCPSQGPLRQNPLMASVKPSPSAMPSSDAEQRLPRAADVLCMRKDEVEIGNSGLIREASL